MGVGTYLRPAVAALFVMAGAGPAAAQCGDGKDRHVIVNNDSSLAIYSFYASRVGIADWQEDILGTHTILPGHESHINIDDGSCSCHYDFKAVMADGQVIIRQNVNVCTAEVWTISDPN
jgi:hypothetical protein